MIAKEISDCVHPFFFFFRIADISFVVDNVLHRQQLKITLLKTGEENGVEFDRAFWEM